MKKYIFFLFCFLLSALCRGQYVVKIEDAEIAGGIQKKQLEKSTEILKESQKEIENIKGALKKTQNYLNKVNRFISEMKYYDKANALINRAKSARDRTKWLLDRVENQISKKSLSGFLSYSISLLDTLNEDISIVKDILKDAKEGGPKMSDFQRMTYLDEKLEKMELKTQEIEYEEHDLAHIAATERVLNRIK